MGVQCDSTSASHKLQEILYDSLMVEVLYNILIEFGVPMRLVGLIKI
jgi:hypothetical protein